MAALLRRGAGGPEEQRLALLGLGVRQAAFGPQEDAGILANSVGFVGDPPFWMEKSHGNGHMP